jgi:tetratricopeptide (TPR) repeat protein
MAKKRVASVGHARKPTTEKADVPVPFIRLREIFPWIGLCVVTLAAYWPALQGAFLWDDSSHITSPQLRSWHGLWRIWFDLGATQQYYPLLHSAFWVEHQAWGDAVLGYHLVSVALHAACACLVVLIVRRLSLPGAWLAGFLFALHPVCVESVAWMSEQKSTLSGLFYLSSALVYLHFDQSRRTSRYLLALALFLLALLSKTVTATLPAAVLVVLWWQRGRLQWKRDVLPLAPWVALGATAGLFTAWVERTYIGAKGPDFALTLLQRALLAGRVLWFYALSLLWPANLIFFYPHWTIDSSQWWQYMFPAGVLTVGVGLALLATRHRGPLAAFLLFSGTLFPVLGFFNIFPFRYSYVADHFQYLASLAILVPAAAAFSSLVRQHTPKYLVPLSVALPAILGLLTWQHSAIYQDTETLYRDTLARNPDSWVAHNNLGNRLLEIPGRTDEAIAEFQSALRLKPDYSEAHGGLGSAYRKLPGRLTDAIAEYQIAVRMEPGSAQSRTNLGNALAMAGRVPEAIAELETVVHSNPDSADAHSNLGNALRLTPEGLPHAIAEYQAAIREDPTLPEPHNNLGSALAQTPGHLPEAIAEFDAAIHIRPDFWTAHDNLGNALEQIPGRLSDAITEFRAAVKIAPDSEDPHYNLAYALSQTPGQLPEAVAEYEAALRIDPGNVEAHFNLANALMRIPGHTQDALAEFEAILKLDPDFEPARQAVQALQRASRL